ncbi:unnamed protein product, partial [Prunus brigantina]
MAMPNHAMSCFKLPVSLCWDIESEIARFWWKNGKDRKPIHWVGWKHLSMLKKDGGLGFRDLVCFNLAMLAKVGWRILGQPHSLLGRVLHDKYHSGSWRCDLISRLFPPNEARLITSLPISRWGCPDRLMWHFHKQGVYTVRSGYDLALYLKRNGELGVKGTGEGSRQSGQAAVWKGIWRLRIPPKLQTFLWKACRSALAVRHN